LSVPIGANHSVKDEIPGRGRGEKATHATPSKETVFGIDIHAKNEMGFDSLQQGNSGQIAARAEKKTSHKRRGDRDSGRETDRSRGAEPLRELDAL